MVAPNSACKSLCIGVFTEAQGGVGMASIGMLVLSAIGGVGDLGDSAVSGWIMGWDFCLDTTFLPLADSFLLG